MQRNGHHCRRNYLDATSMLMLVALLAICRSVGAAPQDNLPIENQGNRGELIEARVELLWASEIPRRWAGSISWSESNIPASSPRIASPVLLGSGPILSAGVFATDRGGLVFGPPSRLKMIPSGEGTLASVQSRSGGISFRVQGHADDRATLQIEGDDVPPGFSVNFRIGDLASGNAINSMVNENSSVTIRRVVAGDLRVRLGDSSTIFWTDQTVDLILENPMSVPINKPSQSLVLDCVTYSAADDSLVSSVTFPVMVTAEGFSCPQGRWISPSENGAYRVRFRMRDSSADRGWLPAKMNPTTMAESITRSITTTLPQSLTTPLNIPLSPFNTLGGSASSQTQATKEPSVIAPSLGYTPLNVLNWQSSHEPAALAETILSVVVIASPGELPVIQSPSGRTGALQPASKTDVSSLWIPVGSAVVRNEPSTVSRLFVQPTAQWFGGGAGAGNSDKTTVHAGQRVYVIDSGQQLEMSIPVAKAGVRHRATIRLPSESSSRLVAEFVDIDPSTGVPQPLGPGLAIIRSGLSIAAATMNLDSTKPENAQVSGVDPSGSSENELWQEVTIDFWPRSPATRLVLSNRSMVAPVHVGRVDVKVNESTTASPSVNQLSVPSTGDGRLAAMRLEMKDLFEQFSDSGIPTASRPLDYQQVWVATNRLIETLQREGYSGVILTVSSDGVSLFPGRTMVPSAAWNANWASDAGAVDPLRLMLRMFERESLQLIPCIRHSSPVLDLEHKIRSDASTASITAPSPLAGQLGAWNFDSPSLTSFPIYNNINSEVLAEVVRSIAELNERCRDRACVPAIGILVDERSYLRPTPLQVVDESTLNEFHSSLGDSAPPREALTGWVQKVGANAFQRWRANRIENEFQQILDRIEGKRLVLMALDSALPSNLVELGRDRRIITTRLHRRALTEPLAMRIRDEACNASVPVPIEGGSPPQAYLAAVFHQPTSDARTFEPGPYGHAMPAPFTDLASNAVLADQSDGAIQPSVTPLLDPIESSMAFAHLLNRSDRHVMAIGGGAANQPASDVRRRSLKTFMELPPVIMHDVESNDPARASLRVRSATYNDETYIYAVNQTRWPVVWEVNLSRPATVHRLGPTPPHRSNLQGFSIGNKSIDIDLLNENSNTDPVASRRAGESSTRWQTFVDAGELVAIRIRSREAKLVDWRTTFAGTATQIATMRTGVDSAVAAVAETQHLRRIELIGNSSFEADGGGVTGWMTAQFPTDCVAIDSNIAFDGARSIRLTGQPGRAGGSWIVSQTIAAPKSGRMAVSVRFRGGKATTNNDDNGAAESLVVRMALEGTSGGTPIRKTKSVTLEANGTWGEPQWLEIAKLPNLPVESLRLTIDLMSAGEVWVDDIVCYDQFMTAAEKTHWEHLVFLAAGGLSRGDWVGASRLFDSHWALDLVNSTSHVNGYAATASQVRRAAFNPSVNGETGKSSSVSPVPAEQNSPSKSKQSAPRAGWSDRLKSWLPRPLRFGS